MAFQQKFPQALIDRLRERWSTDRAQQIIQQIIEDLRNNGETWPALIRNLWPDSELPITEAYVADLRGINLDNMDLSKLDFCFADLRYASFRGCNLNKTIFQSADISHCDFTGSNMRAADLFEVKAYRANFTFCTLTKAMMMGSDFSESTFRKAVMHGVVLDKSNLSGCFLTGADLADAELLFTQMPEGFRLELYKGKGFDMS
ncbi:hypothetical protein PPUJ20028_46440 [Pseudomonas putida]|uniref:Pentapeptide repeat-containing protein n=1 Tax=Pseudomonas putida TaxID=303 RepID=A0AA37RCU5_PSEPU|nr:pentapeptide repeat-containing protein [Pseudomonas putida]GLO16058.1 hypothetical protein PPUJ20028_46440 [Pseudomonas putida]GLO37883.1 hypothetical protein PPUN14671_47200 [Pseudomonas putida]HDS0965094.1 pentapeptide repeat-containing protein [Pseudomonas putida]HDS0991476.1 pentapeptide repeat-containing protein [Pseudomonas putida]